MKAKLLTAILIVISPLAHAGSQTGTIQYLRVRASDGLIYFGLSGSYNAAPSCATASGAWAIRDENSNAGKQQYAMLLAAKLAGKSVAVSGLNTCLRWGDREDANEIQVID